MSTPLPDQAAEYAADIAAATHGHHRLDVPLQRAFMAGALAALTSKAPREPTPTTAESYARALPVPPGQRDPVPSDVWLARVPKPAERVTLSDDSGGAK